MSDTNEVARVYAKSNGIIQKAFLEWFPWVGGE